jgi:hypothetical protein
LYGCLILFTKVQRQPDLEKSAAYPPILRKPDDIEPDAVFLDDHQLGNRGVQMENIGAENSKVSFFTSFKAILSGTSFSITTPTVGE